MTLGQWLGAGVSHTASALLRCLNVVHVHACKSGGWEGHPSDLSALLRCWVGMTSFDLLPEIWRTVELNRSTSVLFQVLPASQSLSIISAHGSSHHSISISGLLREMWIFFCCTITCCNDWVRVRALEESKAREGFVQLVTLVHYPSSLNRIPSTSFPKVHCTPWPFCNGPPIHSRM